MGVHGHGWVCMGAASPPADEGVGVQGALPGCTARRVPAPQGAPLRSAAFCHGRGWVAAPGTPPGIPPPDAEPGRAPRLLAGASGHRAASAAEPAPGLRGPRRGRRSVGGPRGTPSSRGPPGGDQPRRAPPPRAPGSADFVSGAGCPGESRVAPGPGGRGTPFRGWGTPLRGQRPPPRPAGLPRGWMRSPRPGPPGPTAPGRIKRNRTKSNEIRAGRYRSPPGRAAPTPLQ